MTYRGATYARRFWKEEVEADDEDDEVDEDVDVDCDIDEDEAGAASLLSYRLGVTFAGLFPE